MNEGASLAREGRDDDGDGGGDGKEWSGEEERTKGKRGTGKVQVCPSARQSQPTSTLVVPPSTKGSSALQN